MSLNKHAQACMWMFALFTRELRMTPSMSNALAVLAARGRTEHTQTPARMHGHTDARKHTEWTCTQSWDPIHRRPAVLRQDAEPIQMWKRSVRWQRHFLQSTCFIFLPAPTQHRATWPLITISARVTCLNTRPALHHFLTSSYTQEAGGEKKKTTTTNRSLMQLATFIICFETKFRNHIMT